MSPFPLKTFIQPQKVYRLEYPAHWDAIVQKDGESCGFGPHERDDVGLWISVMPMSVDTERFQEDLPKLMRQSLSDWDAENLRRDTDLRGFGMVADITKDGQGGHYWIVAGGDVVLLVSSQVPAAERDVWNPLFQQLMASLEITRGEQLVMRQAANELLAQLKEIHPEQEFHFEDDKIKGLGQVVFLSNMFREIRAEPKRRDEIIKTFANALSKPPEELGYELWDDVRGIIVPVLKHRDYINPDSPTRHLLTTEWLTDVLICYAIRRKNMFRFVTGWDVGRWGLTSEAVHDQALANLARMPWPARLVGARMKDAGRVIVVDTDDKLASSRLLHPDLHHVFSPPLGTTFLAGIPCRDRLVLFSDRRDLKQRIGRKLKKDHAASAYAITPHPFRVTRDGIAPPIG